MLEDCFKVEDGKIKFELEIDTLIFAVKASPYLEKLIYNEESGDWDEDRFQITDKDEFVKGIIRYLCDEREDGSTLMTDAFDKAFEECVEQGEEGFTLDGE